MEKQHVNATIKDVAKRSGVSTATVSHVINQSRFVSEEITVRVKAAISELEYYPNHLVGSLRKNKSYTIGLVLASISNETLGLLAEKIQRFLFIKGYNLIICNTSYDAELEDQALNTLIMKKVDAIIAIPIASDSTKLIDIQKRGIPILLVDRNIDSCELSGIRVDNFTSAMKMTQYLIDLGHRNIAYIDRKKIQSHSKDQRAGFIAALEKNEIINPEENIIRAEGFDYQAGYEAAQKLIAANPKITAIFAYYDVIAFGAIRGLLDLGYHVPNDISVVGYDGMPFTKVANPRLTTVEFPVNEIAQLACDNVIKLVEKEQEFVNIVLDAEMMIGESSAKPRFE